MIIRGSRTEVYHLLKMIDENEYVFISRMFGDGKTIYFFWMYPHSIELFNIFDEFNVQDIYK